MKKLILMLAVLLLAAPAMATDVEITAVAGPGPNDVTVGFIATNVTEPVRAVALDVTLADANAVIADINCVNEEYGIYPGSISIDASGNVTNWGSCAGAGMDSNLVATEQGSLYVGANTPAQSGDLFIITLGGCTVDENGGRCKHHRRRPSRRCCTGRSGCCSRRYTSGRRNRDHYRYLRPRPRLLLR